MTTSPVMTVTDELLAEIAQELNRCKFSDDDDGDESWPSISGEAVSALTSELRRLRAENAELAKDSGRLDLLDSLCESYGFQDVHEGNRWVIDGPYRDIRAAADSLEAQ